MHPKILEAKTTEQIESCWPAIQPLRPHLKKEELAEQVKEMMEESYRMIYVEVGGEVVAFSGFREMNMLYAGKIIYIDDLSTVELHRGKGYASLLLKYIHQLAKDLGKTGVYLDSAHHRYAAHRLYLNQGYNINAHHFAHIFK